MKRFAGFTICLLVANTAFGVNITDVRAGAKRDLDSALQRLSELRQKIEKEKLPLVRELNALERDAREKREEFDRRLRLRDNREAGLIELRRDVEEAENDLGANLGLLRDYVRSWRNGLPNPIKAELAEPLANALTTPKSNSSAAEDIAAEIRVARLSLKTLQESFGGTDCEDFHHIELSGSFHAGVDELPTHAAALKSCVDCQALELGKLGSVDFDGGETDQFLGLFLCLLKGHEPMSCELDNFGFCTGQKQALHYIRSHQGMDGLSINGLCLPQLNASVLFFR